jgi:hypothetical protein
MSTAGHTSLPHAGPGDAPTRVLSIEDSQVWAGGRYEPIAQIGRGGMAEVVLAMFHAGGGGRRLAVLKRIWPELASEPDFVRMFLDEARLSLLFSHPNVVQTHEVIVADTELAIAMEYLEGQPFGRVINRFRRTPNDLSLAMRLRIINGALAGLEHAHSLTGLDGKPMGVVHRDVSPQNLFVTYEGQVKLVDFGVAKTCAALYQTRPGTIKGKVAYMAPEQVRGAALDRRADLFSVGVILWEMLAGRRLWQGLPQVEIVDHLASARPMPPLPADPGIPAGLDAICARALEPDPDRRYQTAAEMEFDIECIIAGATDSHPRQLGKLLALAFADERRERQALIDRYLREDDGPGLTAARPTAISLPAEEPALPAPVAEPEPLEVSARDIVTTSPAASFWRRATAVSGLLAATLLGVVLGGWRVEAARRSAEAVSRGAAPAPIAGPAPTAGPMPASSAPPSPGARPAESPARRHHPRRQPAIDEDATLPPSVDLTER